MLFLQEHVFEPNLEWRRGLGAFAGLVEIDDEQIVIGFRMKAPDHSAGLA